MDAWNTTFQMGRPIFSGYVTVVFREGNRVNVPGRGFIEDNQLPSSKPFRIGNTNAGFSIAMVNPV